MPMLKCSWRVPASIDLFFFFSLSCHLEVLCWRWIPYCCCPWWLFSWGPKASSTTTIRIARPRHSLHLTFIFLHWSSLFSYSTITQLSASLLLLQFLSSSLSESPALPNLSTRIKPAGLLHRSLACYHFSHTASHRIRRRYVIRDGGHSLAYFSAFSLFHW